ncbi:hypothetical protein [Maliponia aquimaris]|jgi:hypothetical protein|uniref:Uncharacterized protein n=1 Tax=Maliponia aquimaris TaxID=1673631 RepID=A0A238KD09_9RHOB|nr:hypothetical protein [Maliponia aquimaris]SMX40738.1 hypothetical protein MAA8898_02236 [Maliponia aquimaris]
MKPEYTLLMVSAFLVMGAKSWRQRRIRRAVRDLPTRLQRQLGEGPTYLPPDEVTPDLEPYVAVHRRTGRIEKLFWGLAILWLAYVAYLEIGALG